MSGQGVLKTGSIQHRVIIILMAIIIPTSLFIIFENLYAISVVRNQVAIFNRGTLRYYVKQIEETLESAEKSLLNIAYMKDFMNTNRQDLDDYDRYEQSRQLLSEATSAKILNPKIDGFFWASSTGHEIIKKSNDLDSTDQIEAVRNYIIGLTYAAADQILELNRKHWYGVELGDSFYLFRIHGLKDNIIGSWIKIEHLLSPLMQTDFGHTTTFALADGEEEVYSHNPLLLQSFKEKKALNENYKLTSGGMRYIVLSEKFEKEELRLIAVIREKGILEGLDNLQIVITVISFLSLLLIPAVLYFINKSLLSPLNMIVQAMREAKKGNLDARILNVPDYVEYEVVKSTFREMLMQIGTLKFDVYEEQLLRQKAQMQYFQLQIKPHFLMNCMNLIYGLAEVNKKELLQTLISSLVRYFRFTLSLSESPLVALKQEAEHVRNYLEIQKIRYPGRIEYSLLIEQDLEEALLPPVTIQSFAENSVKYSSDADAVLRIEINVITIGDRMNLKISDNGEGFSDEVLEMLDRRERVIDDRGKHIGIFNVLQRLHFIYGGRTGAKFYNSETHGAVVEIELPLNFKYPELGTDA